MVFVDCPIPINDEEWGESGIFSTLWATTEILSVVLKQSAQVLFFTSLTCPLYISTNFCIIVWQGAS